MAVCVFRMKTTQTCGWKRQGSLTRCPSVCHATSSTQRGPHSDRPLDADDTQRLASRRSVAVATFVGWMATASPFASAADFEVEKESLSDSQSTEITQKVVLKLGRCEGTSYQNRTLGDTTFCKTVRPIGAMTIGLFGERLPTTVENFVKTVESGAYNGTVVNRVRAGEYLLIGRQGTRRMGEVEAPNDLLSNPELTSAKAFALRHVRPGTVSLAIAQNEDPSELTLQSDYHPTQFLITTGPGPSPQLDNGNVVFGRLMDGFDTLAALAEVRTFQPSRQIQAFNAFARAIGDERATEVRNKTWGRPIQPIVIVNASCSEI